MDMVLEYLNKENTTFFQNILVQRENGIGFNPTVISLYFLQ